jgi:Uma2 family endonuclease
MNTVWRKPLPYMTADDFLAWPGDGTGRTFQLVDGEVRPVSPASTVHGAIQANLAFLLKLALRTAGSSLHVVTEAAIIPALNAGTNVRVPDLAVTAALLERSQQELPVPLLIIEVLSPGNQDDTRDNIRAYATLPSVQEMVVLYSTRLLAEVHRRDADGAWLPNPETVAADGRLRLPSAGLDVPLIEAYEGTWLAP